MLYDVFSLFRSDQCMHVTVNFSCLVEVAFFFLLSEWALVDPILQERFSFLLWELSWITRRDKNVLVVSFS